MAQNQSSGSTGNNLEVSSGLITFEHSVFVRANASSHKNWSCLASIADKDSNSMYMRMLINSSGDLLTQVLGTGGNASFTHGTTVSTGTWNTFGMTAANSSFYSYVNGIQSSQDTTAVTGFSPAVDRFRLFQYAGSSNLYPWQGDIAEAAVWNVALSADDFTALNAGVSPLFVRADALVFYAPLIRDVIDIFGGNSITTNGTVTVSDHPRVSYPSTYISFEEPSAAATTKLLKLPKEFYPGFSTKVKPTVPVVIDYSNPLARGLRAAFIFQDGSYTNTWDHVNKRFATATNATNQGVNAGRESIYFNDAASQKIDLSYIGDFSDTETLSVYSRVNYQSNAIDHALIDINNNGLLFWADQESGTDLRPAIYAATPRYATTGALNGPGWLSWGGSADRSGGVSTFGKPYVNGVLDPLGVSDNAGNTDWTTSTNIALTSNWTIANKESDAYFEYIYVWDRVLSAQEFKLINEDPYQIFKPAIDITYFTSTAGVGATTITTTLDAILKKTQSKTTTLDAILKQVQTLTTDLDSILKKTQTKTTTLDSTLQKTQTKTTTLDAVLEGGGTKTTTLDSILQKTQTKTTTLDSILQKTQSKTTTLDGILQKLQTKNTTLDSILKKTFELTTTLDAVLTTPGAKLITTNLDSILQKTIEVTTTVDAILRKTFSKTTSLDSYLKARKLLTTSIDAALKGTQSATITIDAILTSGEVWVVQANSSDIWTVQTNNSDTWTVV